MSWFKSNAARRREQPARSIKGAFTNEAKGLEEHGDIAKVLEQCCEYGAPALVICPDELSVYQAQFARRSPEHLILRLFTDHPVLPFRSMSLCFVSFAAHARAGMFISRVVLSQRQEGFHRLVIELPDQLASSETRKSFRVPVALETELLAVAVTDAGRKLRGRCTNVSLGGALVQFDREAAAWLPVGSKFTFGLKIGEIRVTNRAEVRRATEEGLGLFFPDAFQDGELSPSREHLALVRELERIWLQRNASSRR